MDLRKTETWFRGLIAAAVAGLGTGMTGWAVGVTAHQLKALIAVSIVTTDGAYLKQSPLPPE